MACCWRTAALVLAAAGLVAGVAACDGAGRTATPTGAATGTSAPAPRTTASSNVAAPGCPAGPLGEVDPASVLVAGPVNGLPPSEATGEKLTMVAVVVNSACQPVRDASVRVWHTDARGLYGPAGTQACCYYGGTIRTDDQGLFRLDTIRPAQYPQANAPPAHIHLDIQHPSARMQTEIVFTPSPPGSGTVAMDLRLADDQRGGRYWYGEVTLVLAD